MSNNDEPIAFMISSGVELTPLITNDDHMTLDVINDY